jgi:uncharacterized protein (TIGR01777 family)
MRVIITGGAGFIGRALADSLTADGYEVILLSRRPERVTDLPQHVRAERWDGRTAQGWAHLADGAAAIVNLAGASLAGGPWTAARRREIRESRTNAGQAVVEAVQAATRKPGVVIQASAVGYYGPHGDEDVTEETPPGDDFLARVCVDWEASTAPVEALGVRRAIMRTSLALSPKGGIFPLLALPFRLFVGGPLGSGRQGFPWIHLADEIGAIRFLLDHPEAHGPFNLSAPDTVTNAAFSHALARALGRPSVMRVPAFAIRLALGGISILVLGGQRQIPRRLLAMGYRFQFPRLEGALTDLARLR